MKDSRVVIVMSGYECGAESCEQNEYVQKTEEDVWEER